MKNLEQVPISKIKAGLRHRRDFGDIEALAASIADVGLLQPVGVDRYYNLIFGARRLMACEHLGWKSVLCVILSLESVLLGEYAENIFRKDFTRSERVAIGKALEEEIAAAKHKGGRPSNSEAKKLGANAPSFPRGKAADIAAKRAGFGSRESYERAKSVVDHGTPELQRAMDEGSVSVAKASVIAAQPKEKQAEILAMPKDEYRTIAARTRRERIDDDRKRDLLLYRGLYDAVTLIANLHEDARETWAGLWRVAALDFNVQLLDRAIRSLDRLRKEHPNDPGRPKAAQAIS